jgi:hypothetical protein
MAIVTVVLNQYQPAMNPFMIFLAAFAFPIVLLAQDDQDPRAAGDGSWVGISGTVQSTANNAFVLNYGDGTINVELERENAEGTEHAFLEGEQVTVYGIVNEGFFRATTIQARAVFVESMSTYTYVTDGFNEFVKITTPGFTSGSVVQGVVTASNGRNLTIDKGDRSITIDTSILAEDPATAEGTRRVQVGDRVTAVGTMGRSFWTGRTLRASSLYKLGNDEEDHFQAGPEFER